MSRQLAELETVLQQLVTEHGKLLGLMDAQQAAMRKFDLAAMDDAVTAQQASRLRISSLETKRKSLVTLLTRGQKIEQPVTITKLATLYPQRREPLLKLRDDLKAVATAIASRTKIAAKLANGVLGHLNSVVRLLAGAVERAGVYTKDGIPRVSARVGIMEAVG